MFILKGSFLCPICFMSFENSDILTQHFTNIHDNPDDSNSTASNNSSNQKNDSNSTNFNSKIENVNLILLNMNEKKQY